MKPCLLMVAGGLAAQHTTLPLSSDLASLVFVASLVCCAWGPTRSIAAAGIGFALFVLAGFDIVESRLDANLAGDSMLTQVRIADVPQRRGRSLVMRVEPLADVRVPRRVRVSWFEPRHVPRLGDVWELELRLRQPRGHLNPGGFDYETWMFREGYQAAGYVVAGKRNRLLWSGEETWLEDFRRQFASRALAAAESRQAAAVVAAIGVGARHLMTQEQWDTFALTGTSHLMAISGLHVGLAASAAFAVSVALLAPFRRRGTVLVPAAVAGVVFAAGYAVVSGLGVPARRAASMLALAAAAVVMRRQIDGVAAVASAGLLVYICDPVASLTPGFQLSFGAVVLLIWLARRRLGTRRGILVWLRQLAIVQMFLAFGLMPLTAMHFQRVAVVAPIANLIAVPLFSFLIVPLVLVALATAGFADAALQAASWAVDRFQTLLTVMASLWRIDSRTAALEGRAWLFLVLPLAWVALPRGWPGRHAAVIGFIAVVTWRPLPPPDDCFDCWFLDVGQGLAIVVQADEQVLVYDVGIAWRGGGSVAEKAVLPFLASRGIRRVDRLLISHGDLDHSGGTEAVLAALDVGQIIVGEALDGLDAGFCEQGMAWSAGNVQFEILHPARRNSVPGNDGSCVVRISSGSHAVLLTGDIEARAERQLVQSRANLAADIVLVPHHGSQTSSGAPFVNSVRPQHAVISAGHANRWGFPKPVIVRRWRDHGAQVWTTSTSGAIYFRVCADGGVVKIRRERQWRRRFWHAGS